MFGRWERVVMMRNMIGRMMVREARRMEYALGKDFKGIFRS